MLRDKCPIFSKHNMRGLKPIANDKLYKLHILIIFPTLHAQEKHIIFHYIKPYLLTYSTEQSPS